MRKVMIPVLVAILLLTVAGVALAQSGSAGYYNFTSAVLFKEPVIFAQDATHVGSVDVAGVAESTFFKMEKQSNVTVTQDGTITPTGSYQPITAAGAVGTASIAIPASGTMLRFVNVGSNAITISDTGTLKLSGDIVLGQLDSLMLISDGTNLVQVATSNN